MNTVNTVNTEFKMTREEYMAVVFESMSAMFDADEYQDLRDTLEDSTMPELDTFYKMYCGG